MDQFVGALSNCTQGLIGVDAGATQLTIKIMVDFKYLYLGICGIANAHPLGTMAGHLGAAVAAGYFIGEDNPNLPAEVFRGIESELDRVIAGEEAIWFDVKKTGVKPKELFRPFEKKPSDPSSIKTIADTLGKNVGQLRQSGHNVIFASIALRVLHGHPDYATPSIVGGVQKLVKRFENVSSGRGFYGKKDGWKSGNQVKLLQGIKEFPAYDSIQNMIDATIDELIATAAIKKQGFGGLWHLINHAAAITELDRMGYRTIAKLALPAHHQHVRLWRSLPNVEAELGPVLKSKHSPLTVDYWKGKLKRDGAQLTHRIKTIFGYKTILGFIEDEAKVKLANDAFLNLMA